MSDKVLIVDDDKLQREVISAITKKLGYTPSTAKGGREAINIIESSDIDDISAVLLDIFMPDLDGIDTLKAIKKTRPDLPVIMLTGSDDTKDAVKSIRYGAADFIVKPADPNILEVTLRNAIKMYTLSRELARLKRDKEGALLFTDLIGHNAGLKPAVSYGRKAAASDVPVLITGETGVGKELFARAIHGESRRVGAPFVAINCGAIPANLIESTLFGHEKGSFTGALTRSLGKFREAEGGTIFLDEVGELPLDAQVKLLRVLQQKEVEPVGAGRPVKINVRIISATNRDLRSDVRAGRFREDLFFRLNVLPIVVPPLRERMNDIIPLAEYFINRLAIVDLLPPKELGADAKEYLESYFWAGNVRELENLIHRLLVICDNDIITKGEVEKIHDWHEKTPDSKEFYYNSNLRIDIMHPSGEMKTMREIENEVMQRALEYFDDNITRTSESLGIAKSTFYRKIKE